MPFNLLLLPLLGGFLLLHRAYYWRFFLARFDGHRLIFFSAMAGVLLLGAATLACGVIAALFPSTVGWWHQVVPFAHSGKAFGALALGFALPFVMNQREEWGRSARSRVAIAYFQNDLELLLLRSMDTETPVLLTMSSGKVYVGHVTQLFRPDVERRFVRILPIISGYRADETHDVVFTTHYDAVRQAAKDPASPFYELIEKDFELVFPVSEVRSISLFSFAAYWHFNSENEEAWATDDAEPLGAGE